MVRAARLLVAMLVFAGLLAGARAEADTGSPCPSGSHPAVIRQSRIKPGGTMAGFRQAEADQEKWYAAHKLPDRLFLAPVLEGRAASARISDRQAMTVHVYRTPPGQPFPPRDAAWNAFVSAFKTHSEIVSTVHACLPD